MTIELGTELRRVQQAVTFGWRFKLRIIGRIVAMSAFSEHQRELEHFQTMLGPHRGALAVTLDLLTNALVLVGQHGVYCHTNRDPDVPVMDIRVIQAEISKAKELIQSVMENMRAERDAAGKV
ncbi:MAG TPA: hypothetical protein VIH97_01845 [Candidatus Acidoferrales bacterium]